VRRQTVRFRVFGSSDASGQGDQTLKRATAHSFSKTAAMRG